MSLRFACLCLASWILASVWGGLMIVSWLDYALIKVENQILRARTQVMEGEVDHWRAEISKSRETDRKLGALLGMCSPDAEGAGRLGVGGPASRDQHRFLRDDLRSRSRERVAIFRELRRTRDLKMRLYLGTPLGKPVSGRETSGYGYRLTPFLRAEEPGAREFHQGQDLAAELGAPIRSTADGVVRHAGYAPGYGLMTLLAHDFGYSTLYAHSSRILVKKGQRIRRGQVIAQAGSSGRSTGPHLHYEIWRGGRRLDPQPFISSAGPRR